MKQNMDHIQTKQNSSILIMKKNSDVTKLSDAISGHNFKDFLFLNEEGPSRG